MDYMFFIDAETDGLYGSVISVAIIVTDTGYREIERHYLGVKKEKLTITNSWVRENVLPLLGDYEEYEDEYCLLEAVWKIWMNYSGKAYAVADVAYPVEVGVFTKCVKHFEEERIFQGPYPMLDLSSLLFAKGVDPLIDRNKLFKRATTSEKHNAMYDVEAMIEICKNLTVSSEEAL